MSDPTDDLRLNARANELPLWAKAQLIWAADELDARAARIAELETHLHDVECVRTQEYVTMRARIAELEAALKRRPAPPMSDAQLDAYYDDPPAGGIIDELEKAAFLGGSDD